MKLIYLIRSVKKYKSKGTGVFVRDSSGVRELQTLDEIKTYYPDFDMSQITTEYYEPVDVWRGELSYNIAYLASQIWLDNETTLYAYIWKPKETGFKYVNQEFIDGIKKGLDGVDTLKHFSECDITELRDFLESLYNFLSGIKIYYPDEYEIKSIK